MSQEGLDVLTVAETAEALGLTERGVQHRLRRGTMRGIRVGERLWVIPRDEVDAWRERGRLKPGRPPKEPTAADLRSDIVEHQDALEEARRRIRGETED